MNGYRAATAVDFAGIDQGLSGTDWTIVAPSRVIWDFNGDYSLETSLWMPPENALYLLDYKLQLTDMVNVTRVELGLFEADELWLMLEDKNRLDGESVLSLSGAVMMDGWIGDAFDLRIRLTTSLLSPTAVINGNDDYSAFGWSYHESFDEDEVVNIE